ncbi:unnamed protein product, partial [Closterium sp. NIES-54]
DPHPSDAQRTNHEAAEAEGCPASAAAAAAVSAGHHHRRYAAGNHPDQLHCLHHYRLLRGHLHRLHLRRCRHHH